MMRRVWALGCSAALFLAACDNSTPQKPATPPSAPVRMACATPEQAGLKAADVTRKLSEAATAKRITEDEYRAFNAAMGEGLRAWAEKQDLKGYCAALDKIVTDAGLQ